jgi:hypothetical protein
MTHAGIHIATNRQHGDRGRGRRQAREKKGVARARRRGPSRGAFRARLATPRKCRCVASRKKRCMACTATGSWWAQDQPTVAKEAL